MLGDKIGELQGQIVGMRVLSTSPPQMEVTFQGTGRLLGRDTNEIGTYVATMRPDGTLYGSGEGLSMDAEGNATTWKGNGVGIPGEGMSASWRGAIYYASDAEPFARLNSIATAYEFETAADGNVSATLFEWS